MVADPEPIHLIPPLPGTYPVWHGREPFGDVPPWPGSQQSLMSKKKATPTPREAFLADILAHPEDDGPRLVYADWLTDHGQGETERARGEFIHLQCRMAGLEEDSPERLDLQPRERDLLADHGSAWMKELP